LSRSNGCAGMTEGSLKPGHPQKLIRICKEDDLVLFELQLLPIQLPVEITTNAV
jgi:hypothetical protein